MPHYALEIRELDGTITRGDHESPEGEWYDTGHVFEYEARSLEVRLLEDLDAPNDQKLICAPV
jgi:hypothetical protein